MSLLSLSGRTLALLALVAFAGAAIVFFNPIRRRFNHVLRFSYSLGKLSDENYAKLGNRPRWSTFQFATEDGVPLKGLVRRPSKSGAPWVVFYPGNDLEQLTQGQAFLERLADGRDWGLFVTSYRGYDSNAGVPNPQVLASDGRTAYDVLLSREHLDPSRVHIVAFSLGGYVATHVASHDRNAVGRFPDLSLMASVLNIEMFHASRFEKILKGDTYDARSHLNDISGPVLVLNGTKDAILGVEQGRAIAAQLGARARYVEVAGVGHNELLQSEQAMAVLRDWIDRPN